jgi:hypothetical protein
MSIQQHALRTYRFDDEILDTPQSVVGSSIIQSLHTNTKKEWIICPFTLAEGLSSLRNRYKNTVFDVIVEYNVRNPPLTRIMGPPHQIPFEGKYDTSNKMVICDLNNFPESLTIVLFNFCILAQVYSEKEASSPINPKIVSRISRQDITFSLIDCDPLEAYNRATIVEVSTPIGKSKYGVLNPGTKRIINNSGGFNRVFQRGNWVDAKGNPYHDKNNKFCWWHRHLFDGESIGIPVRVEMQKDIVVVYMDGHFCSYSCAYAYLLDELKKTPTCQDPNYRESRTLLLEMYDDYEPGKELKPSLHWSLMSDVGNGTMSLKDYITTLHGVCSTLHCKYNYPRRVFAPVEVSYDIEKTPK